jgi:hypothetical protein
MVRQPGAGAFRGQHFLVRQGFHQRDVERLQQVGAQSGRAFGDGVGPFTGKERVAAHQGDAPRTDGRTVGKGRPIRMTL